MSYCALVPFRNHTAQADDVEFRNAHGCCSLIWTSLCKRYGVQDGYGYYALEAWPILWKRVADGQIALEHFEQLALSFTYDYALTRREHLGALADALVKFSDRHNDPKCVNHLPAIAARLRELAEDEEVECVGLYGMSVSENLWFRWDAEADESKPYDLTTGTEHWFTTKGDAQQGGAGDER